MHTNASHPERIDEIDVAEEMRSSFLEYAYSVIYARALPDARDGLKPVQRRIVFQMSQMGLRPDKGHVKSARVVGDVMGRLHPHGDSAIYDALVRLAQPFTMRVPLVDGHGNFGSLDDGPAAPRYTEARLTAASLALTEGLDEDVVDFVPNYDNQHQQPDVLPAAFPNLLVNGASGIAVGMATNMAPHNLVEIVAAAKHLLQHPNADVADLMEFVPGPDLPAGGIIVGLDGIRQAYETGRGAFKTRAKSSIERVGRKTQIVVTELPYLVGPERVIEKIKDGVNAKKLQGLSAVNDLTDRKHGLRLVIDVKAGFSPEAVLEQLYRHTPLEDGFSINAVALVDGKPKTLGLVELLRVYLDHRIIVVRRRSEYRLQRKRERLHLVEGLLIAIVDIDEVIQVIRSSDDSQQAKERLISVFDLSDLQAEYILELRLRRLTKFSRIELENEQRELLEAIAELEEILGSQQLLENLVADELDATAEALGTPRRTLLTNASADATSSSKKSVSLEIADEPTTVLLSATGRILRVDTVATLPSPSRRTRHDGIAASVQTTTRGDLGIVTNLGRVLRVTAVDLPSVPASSIGMGAGMKLKDYAVGLEKKEKPLTIIPLTGKTPVLVATRGGTVKRVLPETIPDRTAVEIISLKGKDEVVGAAVADDASWIVLIASDGQLLRFTSSSVNTQGPGAAGMKGMSLKGDARVIFAGAVGEGAQVVTVTAGAETLAGLDAARAKVSELDEFPVKGRGTGGVASHRMLRGESSLALGWVGTAPMGLGRDGSLRQLPESGAPRTGSGVSTEQEIGAVGSRIGA